MGNTSRYAPDPWLANAFIADAALTAGQVVVQGTADGHCTGPSGADIRSGILGIARNAVTTAQVTASQNNVCELDRAGIVRCVANGTITRGDTVTVATSAGDVKTFNSLTTGPGAQKVGIALESVTTTQNVAVYLTLGDQAGNASCIGVYTAGVGGVTVNMVCTFGTSADATHVILPSGADLTLSGAVAGVALATVAAGASVPVLQLGYGLVTAGDTSITTGGMPLAIQGTTGAVKLAAPGGGTNDFIVGYSTGPITNATTGTALICPQIVQG